MKDRREVRLIQVAEVKNGLRNLCGSRQENKEENGTGNIQQA